MLIIIFDFSYNKIKTTFSSADLKDVPESSKACLAKCLSFVSLICLCRYLVLYLPVVVGKGLVVHSSTRVGEYCQQIPCAS